MNYEISIFKMNIDTWYSYLYNKNIGRNTNIGIKILDIMSAWIINQDIIIKVDDIKKYMFDVYNLIIYCVYMVEDILMINYGYDDCYNIIC